MQHMLNLQHHRPSALAVPSPCDTKQQERMASVHEALLYVRMYGLQVL
jgi:hypothetical protein